jgi:hypothetical protein
VRTDLGGRIYTQRAGLPARRLGLQTLPRGFADPRLAGLQTRSPWGYSQARRSSPSAQGWADPAPGVWMLGPPQRQVAATWGAGRCLWPAQYPSLAAQAPGVRSPRGRASKQALGACRLEPHHSPIKQCNSQWKHSQLTVPEL